MHRNAAEKLRSYDIALVVEQRRDLDVPEDRELRVETEICAGSRFPWNVELGDTVTSPGVDDAVVLVV